MEAVYTLPTVPSELLTVALNDYKLVIDDPRYTIDAYDWHDYREDEKVCHVCLAGVVIAKTLGEDPTEDINFRKYHDVEPQLDALDAFRSMRFKVAMLDLGYDEDVAYQVGSKLDEVFKDLDDRAFMRLEDPNLVIPTLERMIAALQRLGY